MTDTTGEVMRMIRGMAVAAFAVTAMVLNVSTASAAIPAARSTDGGAEGVWDSSNGTGRICDEKSDHKRAVMRWSKSAGGSITSIWAATGGKGDCYDDSWTTLPNGSTRYFQVCTQSGATGSPTACSGWVKIRTVG